MNDQSPSSFLLLALKEEFVIRRNVVKKRFKLLNNGDFYTESMGRYGLPLWGCGVFLFLLGMGEGLGIEAVADYVSDEGVLVDTARVGLFRDAAERGEIAGLEGLALCYFCGKGVPQDFHKAFFWAQKAAKKGDSTSQFILGCLYYDGKGSIKQDFQKAHEWFSLAAGQGNAASQFYLGVLYSEGQGVRRDDRKAFKWYSLSASAGYADAQDAVGCFYDQGRAVKQDEQKALEWMTRAAQQGNADGQFHLGKLYGRQGKWKEAYHWASLSAKKGNAEAQYLVGMMHMGGLGTKMDPKEAFFWWARAAKQGNQDALDMLRKMGKEDLTKDPFFR